MQGGRVCLVQNYLANRILVWLLNHARICWTTYINYYYNILLIRSSLYSLKTHLSVDSKMVFGLMVERYNISLDVRNLIFAMFASIRTGWKSDIIAIPALCLFSATKYNIYIGTFLCILKFHEQDYNTATIMGLEG